MVPLVEGMPIALTDHIDRSPEKQLLRGRIGILQSWVEDEHGKGDVQDGVRILNKLPLVLFVKFFTPEGRELPWRLEGMRENCVYSIFHKKGTWLLDRHRQCQVNFQWLQVSL